MIWNACNGARALHPIQGTLHRLVESQQTAATLAYVDTLEEQATLEALLEDSKPDWPPASSRYHYLLRSPFRYPPLAWGSRFGRSHEPSLLYGSRSRETTLAESAYYRLVFWHAMAEPAPAASIHSQHTLFAARYRTTRGIQLQAAPFSDHEARLTHPRDYNATQALGSAMRAAGVQAFEYVSARDPRRGLCVGLFSIDALADRRPRSSQSWLCETTAQRVTFKPTDGLETLSFALDLFLHDGVLPMPSAA